ncbi:MAG: carbon-nitrogen hydrolase family protein, partial [Bacteroidota bacterium]
SMPVRAEDGIRLRSFLLSPDGELLGVQDQLCPPPGYAPGRAIAPIPSALGRVGIVIERDAEVPEIGRILALQGADLYCVPAALPAPYNPWRQAAGMWQIVQANQVAAVEACLVGEMAGRLYAGSSRLLGAVETTSDGTGVIAAAASAGQTEVVTGTIDLDAQAGARASFPIFASFHRDLYKMLPRAYRILTSACGAAEKEGMPS